MTCSGHVTNTRLARAAPMLNTRREVVDHAESRKFFSAIDGRSHISQQVGEGDGAPGY